MEVFGRFGHENAGKWGFSRGWSLKMGRDEGPQEAWGFRPETGFRRPGFHLSNFTMGTIKKVPKRPLQRVPPFLARVWGFRAREMGKNAVFSNFRLENKEKKEVFGHFKLENGEKCGFSEVSGLRMGKNGGFRRLEARKCVQNRSFQPFRA